MTRLRAAATSGEWRRLVGVLCGVLVLMPTGCGGKSKDEKESTATTTQDSAVTMPRAVPTFDPALAAQYPDIAEFIHKALDTLLIGDYEEYRLLVARVRNPQTEERFRLAQESVRSITVVSIDEVKAPDVPPPVYRVVAAFTFDPDSKPAHRLDNRQIAILVLKEDGEWRLMIAPRELQPHEDDEHTTAPTSQSAPDTPDYPWDEDGDY